MKKVEAVIRKEKFGEVKAALEEIGTLSLNSIEIAGSGEQKEFKQQWRASEYALYLIPKMKLEIVVPDDLAEVLAEQVLKAAWTGNIGDGMVFISPVDEAVRVRTGEKGVDAL